MFSRYSCAIVLALLASGACIITGPRTPATRAVLPPNECAWRGATPKQSSLPLRADGTPDYSSIDASPVSKVLTATIRKLLVKEVGQDSDPRPWTEFDGLLNAVREVNDMDGTAEQVQRRARNVFEGILPSLGLAWVPAFWLKLVKPSAPAWLQHYSFFLVFQTLFPWLMGPMTGVEEVEVTLPVTGQKLLLPQAVKAERCRFLESTQCASVCVNTCKVPSQQWLGQDFGMPIHIQPNYDDFSCVWRFGVEPPPLEEDEAVMVPCFAKCDSDYQGERDAYRLRAKRMAVFDGLVETADIATAKAFGTVSSEGGTTEGGSALNDLNLRVRQRQVSRSGKCWSVAEDRSEQRGAVVQASGETIPLRWEGNGQEEDKEEQR
eukprot:scaffold1208_cov231-Pinguiococcus_pyrenoidosus.AAC.7